MKSNVFGFSAKLALAVLAVSGTILTSCYEEKGIDVTPVEPKPVTYIIAGGVYDAVTNAAVEGAQVASTKGDPVVTGSAFRITGLAANDVVTITVKKDGYFTASRTVEMGVGAEGTTVVVNANIALTSKDSENVPPVAPEGDGKPQVPAEADMPNVGSSEVQDALGLGGLTGLDGGFDANGELKAMAQTEVELAPVAFDQYVPVKVERYEDSFVVTDIKKVTSTKALAEIDVPTKAYLARCVSNAISLPYAGDQFNKVEDTVSILQVANKKPVAVIADIIFNSRSLNFVVDGQTYSVIYMSCKTTSFSFAYDTHDSHDKHDGHGGNPNAGGGIGGSDL